MLYSVLKIMASGFSEPFCVPFACKADRSWLNDWLVLPLVAVALELMLLLELLVELAEES